MPSPSTNRPFRGVDLAGSCGPVTDTADGITRIRYFDGREVIFWWGESTVQLWPDDASNPFHPGPSGAEIADIGRRMLKE